MLWKTAPIVWICLWLIGVCGLSPSQASAFSCIGPSKCSPFGPDDVVFVGEVIRQGRPASEDEPAVATLFRVKDRFHGVDEGVAQIEFWPHSFDGYVEGSLWVIDGVRKVYDDKPAIHERSCSGRSGRLDFDLPRFRKGAEEALAWLMARRAGSAPTTLSLLTRLAQHTGARGVGPVEIMLSGVNKYNFSIAKPVRFGQTEPVAAGTYGISVLASDLPYLGPDTVEVQAGACTNLELTFGHRTRISGQVTTPDGEPTPSAHVSLEGSGAQRIYASARADDDGRFEIRGILPGTYTVRAEQRGYRTTYYGGATEQSFATPVVVESDTAKEGVDIAFAGTIEMATVRLQIVSLDGTVVASQLIAINGRETFEGREKKVMLWEAYTDATGAYEYETKVGAYLDLTVGFARSRADPESGSRNVEWGSLAFTVTEAAQEKGIQMTTTPPLCEKDFGWDPCTPVVVYVKFCKKDWASDVSSILLIR